MHFERLTSDRDGLFEQAFSLYEASFPKHEQRVLEKQRALMPDPLYHFDAIVDDGVFAGIVLYWAFRGYCYIEHFAVDAALRGRSIGSKSLSLFCAGHDLVVLEIDPPVDAVSVRREGFYQRLGFKQNPYPHAYPAYRRHFPPHELVVMSHPRPLAPQEYAQFAGDLCSVVMADAESPS